MVEEYHLFWLVMVANLGSTLFRLISVLAFAFLSSWPIPVIEDRAKQELCVAIILSGIIVFLLSKLYHNMCSAHELLLLFG